MMDEPNDGPPEGEAIRSWIESLGLTADEEQLVLKSLAMADAMVRGPHHGEKPSVRPDALAALRRDARAAHVIREVPPAHGHGREPYAPPPRQDPYTGSQPGASSFSDPNGARDERDEVRDPSQPDRREGERRRRPRRRGPET
jgi:hypothetical protein